MANGSSLVGEPGAVLDGSMGPRTTGLVLHRSSVEVSGLKLTGFKIEVEEDEIYEGHGIFAIDSRVRLRDVTIEKYLNNKPYVARATENSRIWVGYSGLFGNENGLVAKDAAVVRKGANVIEGDLMLDAANRVSEDSPLFSKGDPEFGIPGLR